MKLKCLIHYLKEALILIEKVSGKNNSLPILNSVLFFAKNNELKLLATNLELGLEIKIPSKIEKEGQAAIPAKLLYSFLSNLSSNENIFIESNQNNLKFSTNNTSTNIKGYPVEDFPVLPSIKDENSFIIPASNFIAGINSVYYACSTSEMKPEIASVFFNSQKNQPITFVATDSFRLAVKTIAIATADCPSFLIPFRSAVEIIRIFENEKDDIKLITNKDQIFIVSEKIKFVSRLTEGVFPDYKEIMPRTFSTNVILDKNIFGNNLKTASVFSSRLNEIKMEITSSDKTIKLESSNADFGEHTTTMPADIDGDDLKISFNHKYLIDGLRFMSSDKIVLKFNGDNKPLFMAGVKDPSFCYLVMPMKNI